MAQPGTTCKGAHKMIYLIYVIILDGAWDPVNKVSRLQLQGRLLYKPYGCTGRHPKMPGLGLYKG